MRITPELRLSILEMVGIYSSRFSIPEPRTLMSTREVLEMPKDVTKGRRTTAYKYYGVSYIDHNMIFLNVRKIPNMVALERTLVHELVHLRFPYMSHGSRFEDTVSKGMNGARFGPYRSRKKRRP